MKPFNVERRISDHNQLYITGKVELDKDIEMRNTENDGKDWRDCVAILYDTVPKGTVVDYSMQETRTGFYHTLSVKLNGIPFAVTKKTDTFEGRKPN